jgi:hypothetical protein
MAVLEFIIPSISIVGITDQVDPVYVVVITGSITTFPVGVEVQVPCYSKGIGSSEARPLKNN